MAAETQPPLTSLAGWVRTRDPQVAEHLPLLEQAAQVLAGEEEAPPGQRAELAAALEGWRCRVLDERFGRLAAEECRLVDALDLAANELAGHKPRPPRAAHHAIHGMEEKGVRRLFPERPDQPPAGTRCFAEEAPDPFFLQAQAALDPLVKLDEVARQARRLTDERFRAPAASGGSPKRRMLLYAPLYLSSHCTNYCTYCGFRRPNRIERRHLSVEEALHETQILRSRGFRHLLLVAGDCPPMTTPGYFAEILRALVARGIEPGIEIAPQSTGAYAELVEAGACGITLYQETYQEELYGLYHPQGSKASFHWRLEGIERAAEAGMARIGLGILLGLADPREDLLAMMRHALYLRGRFPHRRLAFSLPRIYDAPDDFQAPYRIDDETFVRFYCALRIAFPDAELVLSTREPAPLRNRLAQICITQMSAGSRTVPGGYDEPPGDRPRGQQFPISDHRTPAEVADWLSGAGIEPVWEVPRQRPAC